MIEFTELKQFVLLHAHATNIPKKMLLKALANIEINANDELSWSREFIRLGDYFFNQNHFDKALHFFNLARYPFADSQNKIIANQRCVESFRNYCLKSNIHFKSLGIKYNFYSPFYLIQSASDHRPLLIVMGGIISIKEQWYHFIKLAKKLDVNLILSEMPMVGENHIPYDEYSYEIFSNIINLATKHLSFTSVHIVAMSFSGNLAIKAASLDNRIGSIFTVGSPINHFFNNYDNWMKLPKITQETLAHLFKCNNEEVFSKLRGLALSPCLLAKIRIPIYYIQSQFDEIISKEEVVYLKKFVNNLHLLQFPDEHGSPHHLFHIKIALLSFYYQLIHKNSPKNKIIQLISGLLLNKYKI